MADGPRYLPHIPQDDAVEGLVILRDGSTATIHAATPDDGPALVRFWDRLSAETRARRFLSVVAPKAAATETLTAIGPDPARSLTLVITRDGGARKVLAVGSYVATDDPATAEVALVVDDAWQGLGLGSLLLQRLAMAAVRQGIRAFSAVTQADNQRMVEVFRNLGFPITGAERSDGTVTVTFSVLPQARTVARQELHDRLATVASLVPFFRPRSVAVVGASRDPRSIGHRILMALVTGRFSGPVYPVNPRAGVVGSIHAYPSMAGIPGPVDLAVLAVPRDAVLGVVDECAAKGVRALVVITAGFAETGPEGRALQDRLVQKVRGHGMRLVGPNCLGLLNADPVVRLNASFAPVFPPPGRVAMSSQSGALGLAILEYARELGLGMSTFVSVGNKADVSGNDLVQYWEDDEQTGLILLYLESFGNPRRFARLARRVARKKPILAVKAGRTSAGQRAAGSHTAALASSDVAVDALFRQAGVIRADTLEDMFDLAALLAHQPLPPGRRVAVLTNAGGPAILCADACEAGGLVLPALDEATRAALAGFLPPAASLGNPVDMIASAGPEEYRRAVGALLNAPEVDALVVIFIPVGLMPVEDVARAIRDGVAQARRESGRGKPVVGCFMGAHGVRSALNAEGEPIPTYRFPESAARALAKAADYAEWRGRPAGALVDLPGVDTGAARRLCREAALGGGGWLSVEDTRRVLEAVDMPLLPGGLARTADDAAAIADRVGYPVAVKLASTVIIHKTEIGGVRLNLASAEAVRGAFSAIKAALDAEGRREAMEGVLVQPMVKGAVELVVGSSDDPTFGPLVAFGLGGIHVEILGDVVFRITPLTDLDAREMVRAIRGYRLLQGYRGHPPADVEAVEQVLLRLSRLVEDVPEIAELDLNPVMALAPGEGCRIVDARIAIHPAKA